MPIDLQWSIYIYIISSVIAMHCSSYNQKIAHFTFNYLFLLSKENIRIQHAQLGLYSLHSAMGTIFFSTAIEKPVVLFVCVMNAFNICIMSPLKRWKNEWEINKLQPPCIMTLPLKMDHAWPCSNASNISIFIKQTENQLNHNLLCAKKEEMQKRIWEDC